MLKLEKVIGLTSLSNASITTSRGNSDTFYAAGNCVVRYNVDENVQKSFYRASEAVSCLAVSVDGRFLAAGERGQHPNIFVWDINTGEQFLLKSTHKHGIGCLSFSPDSQYLVSAGFKHDKQLIVWDWEAQIKISTHKLGNKVNSICFNHDGTFFVTCGDRHLKWWYLAAGNDRSLEVTGKAASILETHKNAVFMDVKVGIDNYVYCATSTGLLCAFNETRYMKMWVQLESNVSYSVALLEIGGSDVSENIVIVGCSEGHIRAFSAKTLQYVATLPLPEPPVGSTMKPAAVLAICTIQPNRKKMPSNSGARKLAAVYGDRSLFIWDITDIMKATHHRSFFYHTACIWDVQFVSSPFQNNSAFPKGAFVTCSADGSIRLWNDDQTSQDKSPRKTTTTAAATADQSQREMIQMLQVISPSCSEASSQHHTENSTGSTSSLTRTIADVATGLTRTLTDPCIGIPDLEIPDRPQTPTAPRALAVHPSGRELVCGDRAGLLRVIDLDVMAQRHSIQAHAAELLTVHYSPIMSLQSDGEWAADFMGSEYEHRKESEPLVLLASAGRDRLVHVFNATEEYGLVCTLDHHTSPVTAVKFTPDGKRLLSCSADRSMAFSTVCGTDIECGKTVQTPHGTINGLAVEASNKFAVSSGQNCRLSIWNLQSGKNVRTYKTDTVKGELYKCDTDPSGMHVAVCAFDKTVSLFDFFSGDLLAQVSGHSELITAVRFSPDGKFLLSVGGDGCIMKWALADRLVEGMQERLLELATAHKMKMTKPDPASSSRREGRDEPVSPSEIPMPMPPSRESSVSPPPPGQGRGSVGGVRTGGIRDRDLPVPSSGDSEGDRWASRVDSHSRRSSSESAEPKRKYTTEMNAEDLRNIEKDNSVFRLPPKGGLGGIVEDYDDDPEKDDVTEMANKKLDGLESWLEDLLKAETTEPRIEDSKQVSNPLAMSLSSKFFDNLKISGGSKDPVRRPRRDPGPVDSSGAKITPPTLLKEGESPDSVAALKARLRSMGVLGATVAPPSREGPKSPDEGLQFESELDTMSGEDGEDKERRARLRETYRQQEEELRVKAEQCKAVVSQLKQAQDAAEASFKDLAKLRASVDKTIASSYGTAKIPTVRGDLSYSSAYPPTDDRSMSDPLECSLVILETDALLHQYKHRFLDPSTADSTAGLLRGSDWSVFRRPQADPMEGTASAGVTDSTGSFQPTDVDDMPKDAIKESEIFSFLDKYSDRLAEMVKQKVEKDVKK